jgi:hypothetical protein
MTEHCLNGPLGNESDVKQWHIKIFYTVLRVITVTNNLGYKLSVQVKCFYLFCRTWSGVSGGSVIELRNTKY